MFSGMNVALPTLAKEFNLDAITLSWVVSAYALSAAIFLIPFGRLADIYGRKKIFLMGLIIFNLFSLLIVFAPSALFLILLRAIQGVGGAMIFATSTAILISATEPSQKGKALGLNVASVYLGLSLGPFLGGILTGTIGWRSIFYLTVALGIFLIYLTSFHLKGEWAEARGKKFDSIGSIIFSIAFLFLMYGASHLTENYGVIILILGILLFMLFVFWELKYSEPIINLKFFIKNTVFAYSNLAALVNYSATSAVTFLLSLYLQYVKGLDAKFAGTILIAQPVFMAIISPVAGKLSDNIEPKYIASIGMGITVIGLLLFIPINLDTPLFYVIINLVILGIGFGLFSSPNTNAVMSSVTREYYGIASATIGTMRLSGQMLSLGIVMLCFSIFMGRTKIDVEIFPEFIKSLKVIFIIFSGLCIAGIFASLARGKLRNL
ncbi:MAG: Efflux pump antibiotic resistance protein [Ignavibacteriae bacterium]|nr:MAG: Efflux pump antibiotic resistance protein [Ignavibacteriota bacterium]